MEAGEERGILQLSNTMPLGPAHRAWPWEEQTSSGPVPAGSVAASLQLPLTALGRGRRGGSRPLSPLPLGTLKKRLQSSPQPPGKTRPRVQHHQPSNVTLYLHPGPSGSHPPPLTQAPKPSCQPRVSSPKNSASRLGAPPTSAPASIDGRVFTSQAQSEHL